VKCPVCDESLVVFDGREGLCTQEDCMASRPCECGAGWVRITIDPEEDKRASRKAGRVVMKPGMQHLYCANGHSLDFWKKPVHA
jgi:hypothetical protein